MNGDICREEFDLRIQIAGAILAALQLKATFIPAMCDSNASRETIL
jgi:hypothetical protein